MSTHGVHGQQPGEPDPADQRADHGAGHGSGDGSGADEARRRRLVTLLTVPDAGAGFAVGGDRVTGDGGRDPGGYRARLGRVCGLSLSQVGVSGAGVTVMAGTTGGLAGHRDQLWATDSVARRLEDLQLTAGEGPCLDAYAAGAPVLVGDLGGDSARWLGFAPDAVAAGAAAVFSLPLQVGAVRLGTLDLHRDTVGALSRDQLADALVLAALATESLLELAEAHHDPDPAAMDGRSGRAGDDPGRSGDTVGWLPDVHAEVHVASGMVSAREGIGVGAALLRIRAYAFARGEPIGQVARRVIDRDLVLDDRDDQHDDDHHHQHDDPDGPGEGPDAEADR